MSEQKDWNTFASWLLASAEAAGGGRAALRRRWVALRTLADEALGQVSDAEVLLLLGKKRGELDADQNDLKAIVAYAAGKGVLRDANRLHEALTSDHTSDPLAFLGGLSGKTFGETWAPSIAEYWLCEKGDGWTKRKGSELYDMDWSPKELRGRTIRIEMKASSEHPAFRFQQVRHPKLSGKGAGDYDILLCLGVTAFSLEWWAVPVGHLDDFTENGTTPVKDIVITRHHGKRRPIWNQSEGYTDEGWFVADARARRLLADFYHSSETLRLSLIHAALG